MRLAQLFVVTTELCVCWYRLGDMMNVLKPMCVVSHMKKYDLIDNTRSLQVDGHLAYMKGDVSPFLG